MRSLDLCPYCKRGRMLTQSTRATKGDRRIRYLKCDHCGKTGTETIPGRPRRRQSGRVSSNLEDSLHKRGRVSQKLVASGQPVGDNRSSVNGLPRKGTFMKPILLNVFDAAKIAGFGWNDFRAAAEDGLAPRPVIVDGRPRWRTTDLETWAAAGCPTMDPMTDDEFELYSQALLAELKSFDAKGIARYEQTTC